MHKLITVFALSVLMLPALTASAKLYKCKDDKGDISYTDKPCANEGEELKLPPLTTYTPVTVPPAPPASPDAPDQSVPYKSLEIISPENNKLVYSNTGTVTVGFTVNGPLQSLQGHNFAIAVDGTQLSSRGVTNQIRLDSVDPGTHTVQVFVVDRTNKIVKTSNTVTFHMRRQNQPESSEPGLPGTRPGDPNTIPGRGATVPGSPATIPGGLVTPPGS